MKKLFLFLVGITLLALPSEAQLLRSRTFAEKQKTGFNRISIGYDAMFLNHDFSTLNGVNLQYLHGFRVAKVPLFLEIGVDVSYNTINYTCYEDPYSNTDTERLNNLSVRMPINVSYKFNLDGKFSIQPYTGFNFKINPLFDYHYLKYVISGNYSAMYYEYSNNKMFQIGWQIGLGFNISKLHIGFLYGLDFMPRVSIESITEIDNNGRYGHYTDSYDLKSSRLLVCLGINF